MIPVVSLDDPRVADYRSLSSPDAIRRAGLFVAEGRLVVRRLLLHPHLRTRSVLITSAALQSLSDVLPISDPAALSDQGPAQRSAPGVYLVEQRLMNDLVGFNIHRGCLALGERPAERVLARGDLDTAARVLILERVNNPDNIGGLFRSSAAFGVDLIVLGPGCADPLYRKAIRTSMAATLQVPWVQAGSWPDAITMARAEGFRALALTPAADARLLREYPSDLPRVALLVGAEGDGLTAEAMAAAEDRIRIATTSAVDSLNAVVAASLALHHFAALGKATRG